MSAPYTDAELDAAAKALAEEWGVIAWDRLTREQEDRWRAHALTAAADVRRQRDCEESQRFVFRCSGCGAEWAELDRQVQPDGHYACELCDEGELLIFPRLEDTWQHHVIENGLQEVRCHVFAGYNLTSCSTCGNHRNLHPPSAVGTPTERKHRNTCDGANQTCFQTTCGCWCHAVESTQSSDPLTGIGPCPYAQPEWACELRAGHKGPHTMRDDLLRVLNDLYHDDSTNGPRLRLRAALAATDKETDK